ncbi:MAG: shikimate kinase [Planctomycetota bacterium]
MRPILIGYRGSGKTTVGRLLAERLGCGWVDTDAIIEQDAGRTVVELFEDEGEALFRDREGDALREALQMPETIISLGGGAVTFEPSREMLKLSDRPRVYLQCTVEELARRIETDTFKRPALHGTDAASEVATVLEQRLHLYDAVATHTIDVTHHTPEHIVTQIERLLRQ